MDIEHLTQANKVMAEIEKLNKLMDTTPDIGVTDFYQQPGWTDLDFLQGCLKKLEIKLISIAYEAKTSTEVLWGYNRLPIHTLGADGSSTWHDEHTDGCNNRFSHKKYCTCAIDLADDVGACVNGSPDDGCDACNMRDQRNMELGW